MRLSAGRSTFAIVPRWLPGLAAPISNCGDEQRLGEQLSIHARIAKLQSTYRGQTHGYCNPHLWLRLACMVVVDFLGPALRIAECRSVVSSLASVHRMRRSSERTLPLDHKLQGHRLAENRQ